jgi:hypothetical protein
MPSDRELRTEQKRKLYMLLMIKKHQESVNLVLEGFIAQMRAEMDQEDFALVEKQVEEQ